MLLTTMDGHIHVLDSFRGTLVLPPPSPLLSSLTNIDFYVSDWLFSFSLHYSYPLIVWNQWLKNLHWMQPSVLTGCMLFQVSPPWPLYFMHSHLLYVKKKGTQLTQFYCWVGSGDGSAHAWSVRSGKQVWGLAMPNFIQIMILMLIQDSCHICRFRVGWVVMGVKPLR